MLDIFDYDGQSYEVWWSMQVRCWKSESRACDWWYNMKSW